MRTASMPPQVHESISNYSLASKGYDARELHDRAERVGSTLTIFADKLLGAKALEAAGLLVFSDNVHDETDGPAASWAIADYWTRPDHPVSEDELFYTAALWGDSGRIEHSAQRYERRLSESEVGNEVLQVLARTDDMPIPPRFWRHAMVGPDVPDITQMSSEVNVESILLKSALALDDIVHLKDNPRQQFKKILEAETTYVPLLDALGLAAKKMALQSEISKARLIAAGRKDLVDTARDEINRIKRVKGQEVVLEALFGNAPEEHTFHVAGNTPYGETVHFGEDDLAVMTDGAWKGRLIRRTKNSLAWKMATNADYIDTLPQDVIGLTAIVPDEKQLATLFEHVCEVVHQSDKLEFAVAASKKSPFYAQGRQEYLSALEENMGAELFDKIQTKPVDKPLDDAFQVVKITFDLIEKGVRVPVEFQFQTDGDRERARVGGANHSGYKAADIIAGLPQIVRGDANALRVIRDSMKRLHGGDFSNLVPVRRASAHKFVEATRHFLR